MIMEEWKEVDSPIFGKSFIPNEDESLIIETYISTHPLDAFRILKEILEKQREAITAMELANGTRVSLDCSNGESK
jgi:hypothetical protein